MSYAHENAYTLVGKSYGEERPVFVLEVTEDIGENIQINENGEVYIRADKIIVVSKTPFCQDVVGFMDSSDSRSMEDVTFCGSRVSQPPKKWQCPYCHFWWEIGERCMNPDCPTNRWDKREEG